mgnify:CR=1 FL=1
MASTSRRPAKLRTKLRIVITAGPTREYLDSIRFISNPSSGKMGFAIATAAVSRGHEAVLITGPVDLPSPAGVTVIRVETGSEMARAAKREFRRSDVAVCAAAVCDYRPIRRATRKLPKSESGLILQLEPTEDIAASLGKMKGARKTLVFALEDHGPRRKAAAKLVRKQADAVLLNGPANIGADRACFDFLRLGGTWKRWAAASKAVIARKIVAELEKMTFVDNDRPDVGASPRSGRRRPAL